MLTFFLNAALFPSGMLAITQFGLGHPFFVEGTVFYVQIDSEICQELSKVQIIIATETHGRVEIASFLAAIRVLHRFLCLSCAVSGFHGPSKQMRLNPFSSPTLMILGRAKK